MATVGYLASVLIGVSLGLIGGGGSILTVPVLVYLFGIDTLTATAYSLFIVGATSLAGTATYLRQQLVEVRTVLVFGIPSILAVFITRIYLVPAIPLTVGHIGGLAITRGVLTMLLFALLMVLASYSMIRKTVPPEMTDAGAAGSNKQFPILILGLLVGVLTGLVGAGGGFLIIPALVSFLQMPVKKAIGTSLAIITLNSLCGFLFSLHHTVIHWPFLLLLTGLAIAGILVGGRLSARIDGKKLKPAFGWFVLLMGIYILVREII